MATPALPVTATDVLDAAAAIAGAVVRTPAAHSETLSEITGADIFVKFENLQFTASYKERGALNALLRLAPTGPHGVVAASAGNFAQAVAHHARRLGIAATIVMPALTPNVKAERTRTLGARVVLEGNGFDEANAAAHRLEDEEGLVYLTPFDDPAVIAGQGTVALELLEDAPDLDALVLPVGGGGLLAGSAVFATSAHSRLELIGVQSERYPAMRNAIKGEDAPCGGPTIAEGIAVASPGVITRAIIGSLVDDVVVVPEGRIEEAVSLYLDVEKTVAEGAGAAGLACVLEDPDRFAGRRVGLVVTGGNIDLLLLASVLTRSLVRSRRLVALTIDLPDAPGALATAAALIGARGANIIDVEHHRHRLGVPTKVAQVTMTLETRGGWHADEIVEGLTSAGYSVRVDEPA